MKLHIYPHGMKEDNAYYDPAVGAPIKILTHLQVREDAHADR